MKLLLLTIGLCMANEFTPETSVDMYPDFKPEQINGKWFSIAMVSDRQEETIPGGPRRFQIYSFQVKENGNIHTVIYTKGVQHLYITTESCDPGRHEFHIEDADPEDFLLISTINEFDIKILGVELYSRRKDGTLNEIAKTKFQQLCQLYGLENGSYIDLTTTDRCFLDEKCEN
ncbi:major urinary protein 4-like [Petaurus breviceps papuanus]|uniref:major urinary protein 4-like n=1 Tax=Petaurus breviceps papuanus TaxID=3040969 RepID=UPI0036DC0A2C